MKVTGMKMLLRVKASWLMQIKMFTRVILLMEKLMVLVLWPDIIRNYARANGKIINQTVNVAKLSTRDQNMKVNLKMELNMDMVFITGQIKTYIKENGKTTNLMESAHFSRVMANLMWETIKMIWNTATEISNMKMGVVIKENSWMIWDMGMGFLLGLMVKFMKGNGWMEFNMEKPKSQIPKVNHKFACSIMVNASHNKEVKYNHQMQPQTKVV